MPVEHYSISRFIDICRDRASNGANKVAPLLVHFHHFLELHGEDGPVEPSGFEMGDGKQRLRTQSAIW